MRTERQKEAARVNGAKSRGPVTPEGKLSSRNAMTHGLLSATILLKCESEERFNALLADLHAELQPQTAVETTLVENMAVARWHQMRIWGMEKALMEHEMRTHAEPRDSQEDAGDDIIGEDNATRCALAFRTLSDDSRTLELINRYESRYDRQYLRAHRRFMELVDRRTPPPVHSPVQRSLEPAPEPVSPAENLPQAPDTVFAKRTRQTAGTVPSYRFAAACALILTLASFAQSILANITPDHIEAGRRQAMHGNGRTVVPGGASPFGHEIARSERQVEAITLGAQVRYASVIKLGHVVAVPWEVR
jgi:hypothetical protein